MKNELLKLKRKRRGLTQQELGALVGMSEQKVCRLETCRQKPTSREANKIASVLDSPVSGLFKQGVAE